MAEEGASVTILDLLSAEGEALAAEPRDRSASAHFWHCDVSKASNDSRVFGDIVTHFGRIDIAVSNAGITGTN